MDTFKRSWQRANENCWTQSHFPCGGSGGGSIHHWPMETSHPDNRQQLQTVRALTAEITHLNSSITELIGLYERRFGTEIEITHLIFSPTMIPQFKPYIEDIATLDYINIRHVKKKLQKTFQLYSLLFERALEHEKRRHAPPISHFPHKDQNDFRSKFDHLIKRINNKVLCNLLLLRNQGALDNACLHFTYPSTIEEADDMVYGTLKYFKEDFLPYVKKFLQFKISKLSSTLSSSRNAQN